MAAGDQRFDGHYASGLAIGVAMLAQAYAKEFGSTLTRQRAQSHPPQFAELHTARRETAEH